ncbi:hypothetical protein C7P63_09070 [Vagococcus humatus]|uniref:Uncharacterized protein n=2 Tax=Vagococcus humatus TaxID=1889241 RepID=A0A3R9YWA2_9ENTE|nr:UPF0223 family protein [Vagococcus humatus]RST88740.1 hypothetical protein C7P63_09070 [Vagococcus humatus]
MNRMEKNYNYPLDMDWSHAELMKVMALWQGVEKAYETGISQADFMALYREFKTVVKSIGEERQLGREFEEASGYSLYRVVQQAKNTSGKVKMQD